MTFLTPTVLGDRSRSTCVHERDAGPNRDQRHHGHFWLRVLPWAERRILTALHGDEVGVLAWAIGHVPDADLRRFGSDSH